MFLVLQNVKVQTKEKGLVTVICVFVYLNVGCFVEKRGYREMLFLVKGSAKTMSSKLHCPLPFPWVSEECIRVLSQTHLIVKGEMPIYGIELVRILT